MFSRLMKLSKHENRLFNIPENRGRLSDTAKTLGVQAAMLVLSFICLAPFYAMLATGLKTSREFDSTFGSIAFPKDVTFEKFAQAWTGLEFGALVVNSSILSISSAVIVTAVASIGAFSLARLRLPGARGFVVMFIAMMAVPPIVVVLPLFVLFSDLDLVNKYPSAIIAEVGINLPFAVFLLYTFMREIPQELFKAAEIDGASVIRQFQVIALPLSRPILATVALVTAVFAWNDLLLPLILWQSKSLQTLMVGLANIAPGKAGTVDIPLVMAGVCISVLPMIVLFLFAQRTLIRGLVEGSIK